MSHSFYITGVSDACIKETIAALPFDDLIYGPEFEGRGWPQLARIHQDKLSIRPIQTEMQGGTLQVQLMLASSLQDIRIACAMVEYIAQKYNQKIQSEDHADELSVNQFREQYGEEWQKDLCNTYLNMLYSSCIKAQEQNTSMMIWGPNRELVIGPRTLPYLLSDSSKFTENLYSVFRRLNYFEHEDVFEATLMGLKDTQTGKLGKFCLLSEGVVTAIATEAKFIRLRHTFELGSKETLVTLDDFVNVTKDSLTWLGDSFFLTSSIEGEQWQALLESLEPNATTIAEHPDLLEDSEPEPVESVAPEEQGPLGIPKEMWEVIYRAPLAVFLMVAGADGEIDEKELGTFMESAGVGSDNSVMQLALPMALVGFPTYLPMLREMPPEDLIKIVGGSRLLVGQFLGEEEAKSYATALYDLGVKIAEASGGGFLGMGSKIDKSEKAMLQGIKKLLQLEE